MRIKEISFMMKAIVNMGDYEAVHCTYGEVLELAIGDDKDKASIALRRRVKRVIGEEVVELRKDAAARRKKE